MNKKIWKVKTEISYNKFLLIFLTALILVLLAVLPLSAETIRDQLGRKVEIPDEIERIAAVGPGALRLVVYLEAQDMVVGVEEFERRDHKKPYILAYPELAELPVIGPQFGGDAELIAAAAPDIVFASYLPKEELEILSDKTDIPVLSINDGQAGSMTEEELFKALGFMAPILNKESRAAELKEVFLHYKEDLINRSAELKSESEDKEVYIGGIGHRGAQGITSTEAGYPPFAYLTLKNIIDSDSKKNFKINKEELLIRDPDIIFLDQGGIELVKRDLKREEFSYLKAAINNEIYELLPYNYYTTNFATMFADAYYIGEIVYSGEFIDQKVSDKADQIYRSFLGRAVYKDMKDIFGGFRRFDEY